jgi:hypothetical protein
MAKVELTLKEYDDLVLATKLALNEKLELKKQVVELNDKYIGLIAKYLDRDASVWTHQFKENVEIIEDNIRDYVSYTMWESKQFTPTELLLAVRYLYDRKFNKR